jgi:hypothetical protein
MNLIVKPLTKVAFFALLSACAPTQQSSNIPKIGDAWSVQNAARKVTRLSIQKVAQTNGTYFLNVDAEGKAGFVVFSSLSEGGCRNVCFLI